MPGIPSMVRRGWALGAASWLLLGSVSVVSWRHWAPLLSACAGTASQGGSRAPQGSTGCWRWDGWFWGPSGCLPSATCSRCVAGTLQAAISISPLSLVTLAPARGRELLSLLSPRGGTHTPGGQSWSARLCRLWACSESPAALLFPGLQAPGLHPQASQALLPALQQQVRGTQSIPQSGTHSCDSWPLHSPGHNSALQRGDVPHCLPALPSLQNGKISKV